MRPAAGKSSRVRTRGNGRRLESVRKTPSTSWFSLLKEYADEASRIGFVLSILFLTSAAVYGLSLSGAALPLLSQIVVFGDAVAAKLGFQFEDVSVTGARYTPQASLVGCLKQSDTKSTLLYDTGAAHDCLVEIGWVASAEIRRVLPAQLEVALTERIPFARWADAENRIKVIDRAGRILGSADDGAFENLLLFSGEGATQEAAAFTDALVNRETIRRRIERVDYVAERFWQVKLDNDLNLKLPRKVSAVSLDRLESMLSNAGISDIALETIDLRLPHRTILQLRDPSIVNRDKAIAALTSLPLPVSPPSRKGKA